MAKTYTEKTVVIDGVVLTKQIEKKSVVDRFIVADKIQASMRFNIASSKNCVNGAGKKAGTFARAVAMQGSAGESSNQRRARIIKREQTKLNKEKA
jgi:hypothetical protein